MNIFFTSGIFWSCVRDAERRLIITGQRATYGNLVGVERLRPSVRPNRCATSRPDTDRHVTLQPSHDRFPQRKNRKDFNMNY